MKTLTREYLKSLHVDMKKEIIDSYIEKISKTVISLAKVGITEFKCDIREFKMDKSWEFKITRDDILDALKEHFPDCYVGYENVLLRECIIIEWS